MNNLPEDDLIYKAIQEAQLEPTEDLIMLIKQLIDEEIQVEHLRRAHNISENLLYHRYLYYIYNNQLYCHKNV